MPALRPYNWFGLASYLYLAIWAVSCSHKIWHDKQSSVAEDHGIEAPLMILQASQIVKTLQTNHFPCLGLIWKCFSHKCQTRVEFDNFSEFYVSPPHQNKMLSQSNRQNASKPFRVLICGGGVSGLVFAHYLTKSSNSSKLPIEITVIEKATRYAQVGALITVDGKWLRF